jgi:hypothetical protein
MTLLSLALALLVQTPQVSIEGTVTRLGTSQPVPSVRVTMIRPGPAGGRGAAPSAPIPPVMTDEKGQFVIPGLTANGLFTVEFRANGYVGQRYGPVITGSGTPIHVALTPAGNIGGLVRDTANQPLVNVPIELLRQSYDDYGRRVYESAASTQTNDRGEYRMYWLTPGRYYLRAGNYSGGGSHRAIPAFFGSNGGANGSDIPSVAGYAFYPAATALVDARAIDLQPGSDLRTVDVTVTTRPRTFSIRGKVVDTRTGKAPLTANVFAEPLGVGLGSGGPETNLPSPAYKPATGTFEIRNLLPGTYSVIGLIHTPPPPGPPGPPGLPEPPTTEASGSITVTVTDSDVNDVTFAVGSGATLVGRLRVEGETPALRLGGGPLVWIIPTGGNGGLERDPEPAFLDAGGNFRVNNVAQGEYVFDFGNFDLGAVGFVKEARLDGADVLNVPIRISGTTDKQLDLVLHAGGGQVTGTVLDVRSQPVPGARVVLIPERARFRADLYRIASTGAAGRFTFPRVAPGDYKVFSWESIETNGWLDPEVLARSASRGTLIHVTESSTETITVQIIPAEATQ